MGKSGIAFLGFLLGRAACVFSFFFLLRLGRPCCILLPCCNLRSRPCNMHRVAARVVSSSQAAVAPRRADLACLPRSIHISSAVYSASKPGPVETKLRKELAGFRLPEALDLSVIKPGPDGKRQYRCEHPVNIIVKRSLRFAHVSLQCQDKTHRFRNRILNASRDSRLNGSSQGHAQDNRQVCG